MPMMSWPTADSFECRKVWENKPKNSCFHSLQRAHGAALLSGYNTEWMKHQPIYGKAGLIPEIINVGNFVDKKKSDINLIRLNLAELAVFTLGV